MKYLKAFICFLVAFFVYVETCFPLDNGTIAGEITGLECKNLQIEVSQKQCIDFEPITLYVQTGDDCRYLVGGLKDDSWKVEPISDTHIFIPKYYIGKTKDGVFKVLIKGER